MRTEVLIAVRAAAHGTTSLLVVFEDRPDSLWLRPLRAGFRHCFCLLRAGRGWILCDSRIRGLRIMPLPDAGVEPLARAYARLGAHVVALDYTGEAPRAFRPGPFSCVELAKRLAGVDRPGILTPFALWRHLLRDPRCRLVARPVDRSDRN